METVSRRVEFTTESGRKLGGILDRPVDDTKAFVVMAHCFTCSKDLKASFRIARGLAERGWGALRFDFMGIGHSEGRFEDSNFETTQEDLRAAVAYLNKFVSAPAMIIGHSFGGATALSIANSLASIRGIVLLAVPSDTRHLADHLVAMNPAIESEGTGEVRIGGRAFTISRQMVESFRKFDLSLSITSLSKATLILHSPVDETVGYHHAVRLFGLISQQKPAAYGQDFQPVYQVSSDSTVSLLSLPNSDHLLAKNRQDIDFVVGCIDFWGTRFCTGAT